MTLIMEKDNIKGWIQSEIEKKLSSEDITPETEQVQPLIDSDLLEVEPLHKAIVDIINQNVL